MNTTRKEFIAALTSAVISTAFGVDKKKKEEFQDIRVDRCYYLKGGQYNTSSLNAPGVAEGSELKEIMDWHVYCQDLDNWISRIEKDGYYLEVYGHLGPDDAKPFGKIKLKRDWLLRFYNLHKNETKQDWEDKYEKYLKSIGQNQRG